MKIKFDFGTQKCIPKEIIANAIISVISSISEKFELNAGRCAVYLTFYDDDGVEQVVVNENDEEVNYLVRMKEYKRMPKNTKYVLKWDDPEAHLYKQYES